MRVFSSHPAIVLALAASQQARADAGAEFFEKRIRPVLVEHCHECHSASAKTKGGLRLDSRADLLTGGETGPAIVSGKPGESVLIAAISHRDKDLAMPVKKPKLPDAVIADFEQWVRDGAVWPGGDGPAVTAAKFDLAGRKERLPWIWKTPERQAVPDAAGSTDVDRFIVAKLAEKNLAPAPATDDRTWLRRAHFAITGLPPTRDALRAFLEDAKPDRRERAVDALLAAPHFGERWARHWMDLVRYAESRGHEDDFHIANAWHYRDYLIRAFNADVPYDRFVAEHIAGDVLPPRLGPSGANDSVLATGWAFLGEEIHNPVDIRQDETERVDNKVDVFSKTFLGLTVACARCHDHKFDAITQRDYYALSGFVLSSSFRQVRFETMAAHERAATELATFRTAHRAKIATAFAESVRPGVEKIAANLLAARSALFGEKSAEPKWLDQLKQAVADSRHPLHFYTMLAHEPEALNAERFPELLAKHRTATPALPPGVRVIADFTEPGRTPWKSDGPTFGTRPLSAGEIVLGLSAAQPIARVMPFGAASRDTFWNRLSLTPGNETDSGDLAATSRSGRMLRTPTVTLGSGNLHYLLRGKARVYAGVDSHIMLTGGLHNALLAGFDAGPQPRWVSHNLTNYAGQRAHLEFSPDGESELDVLMAVESAEVPTVLPGAEWRPDGNVESLGAVAEFLQRDFADAAKLLGDDKLTPRLAPLANWLVQNREWLTADEVRVTSAAAEFLRAQDSLGKTIRWDSPTAVSWFDGTGVDEHVLVRGKPGRTADVAPRALPAAFGFPPIAAKESSGRAELARQLTDPANPLVARVLVNRVWHQLFGRGIVPTVDNFGYLGERPTHPELLDHLAWQFVHEDGWSMKRLIKRLTLTSTFAMISRAVDTRAAEVDPTNALLHRMPVRRLEAETVRDALLVVSGRFNPAQFGRPVPVHLTDFIVGRGRPGNSGPLDGDGRRSIYTSALRNFLPTMMLAFDLPTPFSTVGRRNVTNVPAQSLVLMNDPFVHEQARVWAARLLRETENCDDASRLTWLFESAYARPPAPEETRSSLESLTELRALHVGKPDVEMWSDLCHALLNANDFIYLK